MTDPAIQAAERARYDDDGDGVMYSCTRDAMEEAAREALAPVREWFELHQPQVYRGYYDVSNDELAELARLIYPESEL